MSEITQHAQKHITETLYTSAATHAESSKGLFCAYEPGRFPYQSLSLNPSHYRLEGVPFDPDLSDLVAGTVDKRFRKVPKAIDEYDKETGGITLVGEILKSRQNVILGGDHDEFLDVPFILLGVTNPLRRRGKAPHRSSMIISKAIDYLGINLDAIEGDSVAIENYLKQLDIPIEDDGTVTARSFLYRVADYSYFTVPSSQTFKNIRKHQESGIKLYNNAVLHMIRSDLRIRRGVAPMLMSIALPGTVIKKLQVEEYLKGAGLQGFYDTVPQLSQIQLDSAVEIVGKISSGLPKFSRQALTIATILRLNIEFPQFAMDPEMVCITDDHDIRRMGEKLVNLGNRFRDKTLAAYDAKGNTPLSRR